MEANTNFCGIEIKVVRQILCVEIRALDLFGLLPIESGGSTGVQWIGLQRHLYTLGYVNNMFIREETTGFDYLELQAFFLLIVSKATLETCRDGVKASFQAFLEGLFRMYLQMLQQEQISSPQNTIPKRPVETRDTSPETQIMQSRSEQNIEQEQKREAVIVQPQEQSQEAAMLVVGNKLNDPEPPVPKDIEHEEVVLSSEGRDVDEEGPGQYHNMNLRGARHMIAESDNEDHNDAEDGYQHCVGKSDNNGANPSTNNAVNVHAVNNVETQVETTISAHYSSEIPHPSPSLITDSDQNKAVTGTSHNDTMPSHTGHNGDQSNNCKTDLTGAPLIDEIKEEIKSEGEQKTPPNKDDKGHEVPIKQTKDDQLKQEENKSNGKTDKKATKPKAVGKRKKKGKKQTKFKVRVAPVKKARPFFCPECNKCFINKRDLDRHSLTHSGAKPFKCTECGAEFTRKDRLTLHTMIHTGTKPHTCPVCSKGFIYKADCENHILTHTGEKPHECKECGKKFTRKSRLKKHMCTHGDSAASKPYECQKCHKRFSLRASMLSHLVTHESPDPGTGEIVHKCCECQKVFNHRNSLQAHLLMHTGEKPHQCNECGKHYAQKSALDAHIISHTGEKPYKCPHCEKGFSHRNGLRTHIANYHTTEKPHQCKTCGKGFSQKCGLQMHMLTHTGEKPHVCGVCGMGFSQKGHLQTHSLRHSGLKPHLCSECGKSFSLASTFKKHLMVHTGEKPHECKECGKRFSRRDHWKTHLMTHTGEKPHMCSECGKSYTEMSGLKRHMLTHTGERPFWCTECGKGFISNSSLKKHLQIHEAVKKANEGPNGNQPHLEDAYAASSSKILEQFTGATIKSPDMHVYPGVNKLYEQFCGANTNTGKPDENYTVAASTGKQQEVTEGFVNSGKLPEAFDLKKHVLMPLEGVRVDKPHQCPECGERFIDMGLLHTHMMLHARDMGPHLNQYVSQFYEQHYNTSSPMSQ